MRVPAKARAIIVPVSLYVFAATLLLVAIGEHPPYPINWENYTAWGLFRFWEHPSADVLRLNQGLMTDSSDAALSILPAWLWSTVAGVSLASMRVPMALVSAGAVPLLWLLGRRLFNERVALLAALLLALCPGFLVYGRTATTVAMSLAPALLTAYVLLRILKGPSSWGWLVALQLLLVLGAYAYAPIRFLWPLSLFLLFIEWLWNRRERRDLLVALGVTALVLPTFLVIAQYKPDADPASTLADYYGARGEQLGALTSSPEYFGYYLELTPEEKANGGKPQGTPFELALRLVGQNIRDFTFLLLDINTRPALTDFWNPHGRLMPLLLVPFFFLGLGYAAWRARKRVGVEYRFLLVLFFGFSLPLLLTSRVHVGRLIFALPFLMLLVSTGFIWVIRWAVERVGRWLARPSGAASPPIWSRLAPVILILSFLVTVGWLSWSDYRVLPGPGRDNATLLAFKESLPDAQKSGGVAYVADAETDRVFEEIDITPLWLELHDSYRFVVLPQGAGLPTPPPPGDQRTPIYLGEVMDRLERPETLPNYCDNLYYVEPDAEPDFLDAMKRREAYCTSKLNYRLMP